MNLNLEWIWNPQALTPKMTKGTIHPQKQKPFWHQPQPLLNTHPNTQRGALPTSPRQATTLTPSMAPSHRHNRRAGCLRTCQVGRLPKLTNAAPHLKPSATITSAYINWAPTTKDKGLICNPDKCSTWPLKVCMKNVNGNFILVVTIFCMHHRKHQPPIRLVCLVPTSIT